jgi:uncharacterized protein
MLLVALAALQIAVPPPTGHVNDFAGVLDGASVRHMEAVARDIRAKTRGEIAVVTLDSIGDRPASDVAVQIGRQWGVGAEAEAGDPAKNLGIVILLVPLRDGRRGTGHIFIATGRGAEGFLPDARVGRIRDAMTPYLAREEYGPGLAVGVDLIAQAFVAEFGVALDSSAQPLTPVDEPGQPRLPATWVLILFVLLVLFSRGRIFLLPFLLSGMGGGRRGRWGGGGGGWGGGRGWGGGGGFGGFGGGGGFSGGGAGGRF